MQALEYREVYREIAVRADGVGDLVGKSAVWIIEFEDYVEGILGVVEQHPDVLARAVGAYFREVDEDSEKAKVYLEKARQIIEHNPELIVRKQQWEKFAKSFD